MRPKINLKMYLYYVHKNTQNNSKDVFLSRANKASILYILDA